MNMEDLELAACTPTPVDSAKFNPKAELPYGCTTEHIRTAMNDYIEFLGFINSQLRSKNLERLESFLMPANFSSIVGEFMTSIIPKYHSGLVKNKYHNGHPDMIPRGMFPNDSVQHSNKGIEVKASRHVSGWQGHNPEDIWLLVFVFDSNTIRDRASGNPPKPFKFKKVVGAQLTKSDWSFSGRSETSRRTITASVTRSGFEKMEPNWIYRDE
jgi:hypothetical protein